MNPRIGLALSLLFVTALAEAATPNPVGLWDLFGSERLQVKLPGQPLLEDKSYSTYYLVQFFDGGAFSSAYLAPLPDSGTGSAFQDWPIAGTWTYPKPNQYPRRYQISSAVDQVNAAPPAYLLDLANRFGNLVVRKKVFEQAPTVNQIRLLQYIDIGVVDRGNSRKNDQRIQVEYLQGKRTTRIREGCPERDWTVCAELDYVDPTTQTPATAILTVEAPYQGVRAAAPSACCEGADAVKNLSDSEAFLKANAKLPKVKTTASGLQYKLLDKGSGKQGAKPGPADTVTVNILLSILPSGKPAAVFSKTSGLVLNLGDMGIPGLQEGLQLMSAPTDKLPGLSHYRFHIPPALAYGEAGLPEAGIPPNSVLILDVELVKIGQ